MDGKEQSYQEHLEEWRKKRSCTRKSWRFTDRKKAKAKARELTKKLRGGRLSAYRCDYCEYFHIGHNWTSRASMRHKEAHIEV